MAPEIMVKEVMSKPPITIDPEATAQEAAKLMRKKRRGFLVVTKNNTLVGVLSDTDLLEHIVSTDRKASEVKVKEIMSKGAIIAYPDEDVMLAVERMKRNNIHRLPVVDKGKVVGVITLEDIARVSPEMKELLNYRLKMKERPLEIAEESMAGICDGCLHYFDRLKKVNDQWFCESCSETFE